jgi:hypothetical protein
MRGLLINYLRYDQSLSKIRLQVVSQNYSRHDFQSNSSVIDRGCYIKPQLTYVTCMLRFEL